MAVINIRRGSSSTYGVLLGGHRPLAVCLQIIGCWLDDVKYLLALIIFVKKITNRFLCESHEVNMVPDAAAAEINVEILGG